MEYTITHIEKDGNDFGIYFEVDGKECSFYWDSGCLLDRLLHGMNEEEIIKEFGEEFDDE